MEVQNILDACCLAEDYLDKKRRRPRRSPAYMAAVCVKKKQLDMIGATAHQRVTALWRLNLDDLGIPVPPCGFEFKFHPMQPTKYPTGPTEQYARKRPVI